MGLFSINFLVSTYLFVAVLSCIYRFLRPQMQAIKIQDRVAGTLLFGVFWIFVLPFVIRDQLKINQYKDERVKLLRDNATWKQEYQIAKKALDDGLECLTDESSIESLLSEVLSLEARLRELEKSLSDNGWWLRRFGVEAFDGGDETSDTAVAHFSKLWYWGDDTPQIKFFRPLEKLFDLAPESTSPRVDVNGSIALHVRYKKVPPESFEEWTTYFSPSFKKDVASLDRKLAGRVMTAILDIASDPTRSHGDTQKPLSGPLKGQWRYRLGDYRVVYLPRPDTFVIVFLRCSSRGDVYH